MRFEKDGKYLVFTKDSGAELKYDFSTEQFYKGERIIKHPQNFFRGFEFKEIFANGDERFKRFINKVDRIEERCHNIGTILQRSKSYKNVERWVGLGLRCGGVVRYATAWGSGTERKDINISPEKVNKHTLKLLKKYDIYISTDFVTRYDENFDKIIKYLDKIRATKSEVESLLYDNNYFNIKRLITPKSEREPDFYEYKSLIKYIIEIQRTEFLNTSDILRLLKDYYNMQKQINIKTNFYKYPKFLKSVHEITVHNHLVYCKRDYNEERLKKMVNYDLSYDLGKKYTIVCPNSSLDLKKEAAELNHCVASYIQQIIDGDCQIVLMRDKSKPNKSLISIEIRDNCVTHAKGLFNRDPSFEEGEFIKTYARSKGLEVDY